MKISAKALRKKRAEKRARAKAVLNKIKAEQEKSLKPKKTKKEKVEKSTSKSTLTPKA